MAATPVGSETIPALEIRIAIGPSSDSVRSTSSPAFSASPRSASMATAFRPCPRISRATSSAGSRRDA